MKTFRRWGAVYIILALFAGSLLGQSQAQWLEYAAQQSAHGEAADLSGYLPVFLAAVFENWQSEFLQLALQAWLIASVMQRKIFQADHSADKDDVERILAEIRRDRGEA